MNTIEVKILQYTFHFRQLTWREEAAIKFPKGEERLRTLLAHSMTDVSGLPVPSVDDAMKVLRVIPATVIQRMWVILKGSLPMPRRFSTIGLYKAPSPGNFVKRFEEVEKEREKIMDKVEQEMEQKFGARELAEAREVERQMLKNSKMRGATKPTPDERLFGPTPPQGKKKDAN
jgi:hypothetical protein